MLPQIAPFTFGDEAANAGDMATVQCAVIKGDLPLDIAWSFNSEPITSDHLDTIVRKNGQRASTLTIESVDSTNSGRFTCSVSNQAGATSVSADLSVNGMRKNDWISRNYIYMHGTLLFYPEFSLYKSSYFYSTFIYDKVFPNMAHNMMTILSTSICFFFLQVRISINF